MHCIQKLLLFCVFLVMTHDFALAKSIVEVDSGTKSSVEQILRKKSNLRMDDEKPLKMNSNSIPVSSPTTKKHKTLELAEDALRMIYHELYDSMNVTEHSNISDVLSRSRGLNPRQSFLANHLSSISEKMMSLMEKSLEELPSLPRLEAQECVKRSVCEAHNQPQKYGLIGLVLQLLFPPYSKPDELSNVVSKYMLAARYGRQANANCGVQYDGCMLNLLDIVQAFVNAFIR